MKPLSGMQKHSASDSTRFIYSKSPHDEATSPRKEQEVKMACFTAPLAAAIAAGVARRTVAHKESSENISWATKLGWLEKLSFGGCALLAFEHIWHGEIIFQFPFLTGVKNGETAEVLKEIATVGGAMTALILVIWVGMLIVSARIAKRKPLAVEG